MQQASLTLGQKVKNFRKRAGMSQLDLETAIGTSAGSISRIEGDSVNPTKETLQEICAVLALNEREVSDLLNIRHLKPSEAEIHSARNEVEELFEDETVYAYLVDEWGTFYKLSKGFQKLLKINDGMLGQMAGKNLLEIVVDPKYGITSLINPKYRLPIQALEIARKHFDVDILKSGLFETLNKIPGFQQVWEVAQKVSRKDILSSKPKVVNLIIDGQEIRLQYGRELLKSNPRFHIIEYFETNHA